MVNKSSPVLLRIIAWLSIAMGSLMVLGASMGLLIFASMPPMPEDMTPPEDMGFLLEAMVFGMFRYFGLFAAAQLVAAAIMIWAGIDLLRLRAWARMAVEVFCWLGLVSLVLFSVLWIGTWFTAFSEVPDTPDFNLGAMRYMGIAMFITTTAVFAVPLVLALRYLRGSEARAAVTESTDSSTQSAS
ncbi:MAG: hypothetical protein FWC35_06925 [Proteobacteria bacterium]|nr:hypothetical protein [Pseudomonadota bacterium]